MERELSRRFDRYADEVLLRIVTVERAEHRPEALAVAERILTRRGVMPPAPTAGAQLPAAPRPLGVGGGGRGQPKSPYQLIDFFVDALLFSLLYLATREMDSGSVLPEVGVLDALLRLLFGASLTVVVIGLRYWWRTKTW